MSFNDKFKDPELDSELWYWNGDGPSKCPANKKSPAEASDWKPQDLENLIPSTPGSSTLPVPCLIAHPSGSSASFLSFRRHLLLEYLAARLHQASPHHRQC